MAEVPFDFDAAIKGFAGEAPAAAAGPGAAPAAGSTPFYNRPIAVPSWLKSAGRFVGKAGALGAIAQAGYTGGTMLKNFFEPQANPNAPNPNLGPAIQGDVAAAGGTKNYITRLGAKPENQGPNGMLDPVAGRFPNAWDEGKGGLNIEAGMGPIGFGAAPKAPDWQAAPLPAANTYREIPGNGPNSVKPGIGGVRGVGNTEVVGTPDVNNVGNIAGNWVGSMIGLKQIAGDNANKLAAAKLGNESNLKSAQANEANAKAGHASISSVLAAAHLKANPNDLAGAAAILSGRSQGVGHPTIPMGGVGMNPLKDPSLVFDPKTQTTKLVYPTQKISDANIKASMAERGMTREQAIAAYKAAGHDVSTLK